MVEPRSASNGKTRSDERHLAFQRSPSSEIATRQRDRSFASGSGRRQPFRSRQIRRAAENPGVLTVVRFLVCLRTITLQSRCRTPETPDSPLSRTTLAVAAPWNQPRHPHLVKTLCFARFYTAATTSSCILHHFCGKGTHAHTCKCTRDGPLDKRAELSKRIAPGHQHSLNLACCPL